MRPAVCDAQDHGSEAEWRACPSRHPTEAPEDVFRALLEMYRQAGQDTIHATWGESWPTHKEREAEELRELHTECDRWASRYGAAADRAAAPAAALRALLAELDGWPERPTNFGDACDRLSHLIAEHAGEAPEMEAS